MEINEEILTSATETKENLRRAAEGLFDESICVVLAAIAEREDIDPESRRAIERALAWHYK